MGGRLLPEMAAAHRSRWIACIIIIVIVIIVIIVIIIIIVIVIIVIISIIIIIIHHRRHHRRSLPVWPAGPRYNVGTAATAALPSQSYPFIIL